MLQLTLHSVDSGFCRVYYTAPGKLTNSKLLYCFQQEWRAGHAQKYGYPMFKFYRCSRDGEPDYEIDFGQIARVSPPSGNSEIEQELRAFLTSKKGKTNE